MAKGFVNIIADRMQTLALKTAVAKGLLAYYDEDSSIETNEEVAWTLDGEYAKGENIVTVENIHGAITFIVPEI